MRAAVGAICKSPSKDKAFQIASIYGFIAPTGASHILASKYSATLTRAYHILRACSSVVLSKFQHLPIRTVQQNQNLIGRSTSDTLAPAGGKGNKGTNKRNNYELTTRQKLIDIDFKIVNSRN